MSSLCNRLQSAASKLSGSAPRRRWSPWTAPQTEPHPRRPIVLPLCRRLPPCAPGSWPQNVPVPGFTRRPAHVPATRSQPSTRTAWCTSSIWASGWSAEPLASRCPIPAPAASPTSSPPRAQPSHRPPRPAAKGSSPVEANRSTAAVASPDSPLTDQRQGASAQHRAHPPSPDRPRYGPQGSPVGGLLLILVGYERPDAAQGNLSLNLAWQALINIGDLVNKRIGVRPGDPRLIFGLHRPGN